MVYSGSQHKQKRNLTLCLCFFYKFCMAYRASNLYLAFSFGNTQFIFAFGAMIIPVFLIPKLRRLPGKEPLHAVPNRQKLLIFRPSPRRIAGKHAEKDKHQQYPGQNREQNNICEYSESPKYQI